jgi:hypothetical protein
MQGFFGFIAIAVIVSTPWALAVVAIIALAVIAFFAWDYARPLAWAHERSPRRSFYTRDMDAVECASLKHQIVELEDALALARREAAALQSSNSDLQRDLHAARADQKAARNSPLHRRVGLDQDAPVWVIAAVRRAYRVKLHPDQYSLRLRQEATKRFQAAETVFDEIEAARRQA